MAAVPPPADFHETIDHALDLTVLAPGTPLVQSGTIGNGPDGAADVNYYQFTLNQPAQVHLAAAAAQAGGTSTFVVSLYDTDPQDPVGNRLLAQDDGAAPAQPSGPAAQAAAGPRGQAAVDTQLAAGVYFVAVSGSGNRYFNPYLEGSGYNGDTGDYQLSLGATNLNLNPGDGPVVLRTEPGDGAAVTSSPLLLRAALSGPVDPNSLQPDSTVQLFYDPTDPFTSSAGTQISVASVNYDSATQEIQVTPSVTLAPGYYQLFLAGNLNNNAQVIQTTDATPIPLGANAANPNGQDFTATFQVTGNEGDTSANPGPDDTFATAYQLGDVTNVGLVQTTGAIGDDSTDVAVPFDPADVDIYHFQISGPGNYAFGAEVFANRIGSQLDASMQLYRIGADGKPQLITSNDDSGNATVANNLTPPLFADPVVYAGLTQGDYYLAVTSQFNTYDPLTSHSGSGGFTTGPYVLNLRVDPAPNPPHVVATQVAEGAALTQPPTTLTVTFDAPMDLQPLAFAAYAKTASGQLSAVYIQAADGTTYYPRLTSFDPTTNQATFLMLDALPNGSYTWHLSGANGLTDFAGNALVGNDPSLPDPTTGDYLVHFSVNGPARGTPGNPTLWPAQEPNDSVAQPQTLGVLFPTELHNTVTVDRPATSGSSLSDTADYYQITVLQAQDYFFVLNNVTGLAANVAPTIWADGVLQASIPQGNHGTAATLLPGTYVIGVDWSGSKPTAAVSYQLKISMQASPEPATSLTTGPAPALKLRLAVDTPPTPPTPTPPAPPSPLAPTNTPSAPGTTNPSPTPPSPGGTPTSTGTSGGTPAPVPSNPPPTPPADAPPPASSGPSTPPAVKNLGDVGPVATAPASNDAGTAVATVSQVSAVAPAVVQTSTTTTAPAAPVSIPSGVVLALSDRALGANADASGGARAFLRETANPPTQTVTVESFGSVLASTTAYLSAAAQPAGPDRETLAAIDAAPWAVSSLPAALATRATGVERELLAAALAGARVVPAYAEALAKLLDSWQFGYQPPTPSPSHPTPAHAPTVEPVPPAVEAALEGAVDAALSAPEVRSVPWYHLSNVARAAIVALTMTLVALRVQSWRAARAAAATGTRTPDLPDCAPSDE